MMEIERNTFLEVSIHAPYAGSDSYPSEKPETFDKFQSTPPMQGATVRNHGPTGA